MNQVSACGRVRRHIQARNRKNASATMSIPAGLSAGFFANSRTGATMKMKNPRAPRPAPACACPRSRVWLRCANGPYHCGSEHRHEPEHNQGMKPAVRQHPGQHKEDHCADEAQGKEPAATGRLFSIRLRRGDSRRQPLRRSTQACDRACCYHVVQHGRAVFADEKEDQDAVGKPQNPESNEPRRPIQGVIRRSGNRSVTSVIGIKMLKAV